VDLSRTIATNEEKKTSESGVISSLLSSCAEGESCRHLQNPKKSHKQICRF
jgi:hypothetical protein